MEETKRYEEMKEKALFVTEGPLTREMLLDLQKAWTGRKGVFCGIFIFSIILFILNLVTQYLDATITLMFLFIAVLYAFVIFVAPHLTAKRQYETQMISCGGEILTLLCFTEDGIEQHNLKTDAHLHFDYIRIKKLQKTKRCYFLWLEKNVVLLFSRDHLKKGTEAELEAFLIQKCPLAKKKL